ncbi:MAG: hypothetical protein PHX87_01525 [Candidatus Peribacteraceae bacterium]|nr:hypothetical protein [Candidatus Peribacteraceae bacterium]MDD5742087.1 hypothetical protein [Candidatus Peribacteraceae bacterium]
MSDHDFDEVRKTALIPDEWNERLLTAAFHYTEAIERVEGTLVNLEKSGELILDDRDIREGKKIYAAVCRYIRMCRGRLATDVWSLHQDAVRKAVGEIARLIWEQNDNRMARRVWREFYTNLTGAQTWTFIRSLSSEERARLKRLGIDDLEDDEGYDPVEEGISFLAHDVAAQMRQSLREEGYAIPSEEIDLQFTAETVRWKLEDLLTSLPDPRTDEAS